MWKCFHLYVGHLMKGFLNRFLEQTLRWCRDQITIHLTRAGNKASLSAKSLFGNIVIFQLPLIRLKMNWSTIHFNWYWFIYRVNDIQRCTADGDGVKEQRKCVQRHPGVWTYLVGRWSTCRSPVRKDLCIVFIISHEESWIAQAFSTLPLCSGIPAHKHNQAHLT